MTEQKEVNITIQSDMSELTEFTEGLTQLVEGRIDASDFISRFTYIDTNQSGAVVTLKGRVGLKPSK